MLDLPSLTLSKDLGGVITPKTAKISDVVSVMFVYRIREMVSFKLGKEIEKDVFRLVTSVEQRKNYESP